METHESSNEATASTNLDGNQTSPALSTPKMQSKDVHIPYILNGTLYQILTQEGENVTVKCCNCPPDRVYRGSVRSTGNFHMHIKRRHPDLLGKLHDLKVAALLERRDRYMRNRKLSQRNNNNNNNPSTSNNCNNNTTDANTNNGNGGEHSEEASASSTEQLKIKTAFQKHQQQEAMRKREYWCAETALAMPNNEHEDEAETNEPINFCLKEVADQQQQPHAKRTLPSPHASTTQISHVSSNVSSSTAGHDEITQYCLSHCSTISNGNTSHRQCDSTPLRVKHEPSTCIAEDCAIDLTINSARRLSSGLGSTANMSISAMPQWDQMLAQVETSLRDIQRELRTRNQIETNRLILDVAKFKYLHPGFHFND